MGNYSNEYQTNQNVRSILVKTGYMHVLFKFQLQAKCHIANIDLEFTGWV